MKITLPQKLGPRHGKLPPIPQQNPGAITIDGCGVVRSGAKREGYIRGRITTVRQTYTTEQNIELTVAEARALAAQLTDLSLKAEAME